MLTNKVNIETSFNLKQVASLNSSPASPPQIKKKQNI